MSVSDETLQMAEKLIKQAEDLKLKQYKDSLGKTTVYWGHLVKLGQKFNRTKQEAQEVFKKDLDIAIKRAIKVYGEENFKKLSPTKQAVLIDMSFNMGEIHMPNTIKHLQNGDIKAAANELMDSNYRAQTKSRAYRNFFILLNDKIYTKQQALELSLKDGLLSKNKNGKITFSPERTDPRIKKFLDSKPKALDTDIEKSLKEAIQSIDNKIGGISFDIDPISTRLKGFIHEDAGVKIIEGNIYDESNFSLIDLVVPLKIMYDPEIKSKNISVSLDPWIPTQPEGPWYRKVFYPNDLADTGYGEDMIEADYLMKQLSLGVDEENKPYPYPERLIEMGLDIQSIFKAVKQKTYEGSRTRLWIVIKDYEIGMNQKFVQVKNIKMGVQLKSLEVGENGSLRDCNSEPSPISKRFAELFTKNYDELAEYYPILGKMKRLAKASIIAKFMFFKRIPVDMELINRLFKKEKQEFEQRMPRLQNKLKKELSDRIIEMSVLGGCTFDISNMQSKINDLEKQMKELKQIFEANNLNSTQVPLKSISNDKENIGQFFYVKNEKDSISNDKIYPFLFQAMVKCKHCGKICNLDYYSVTNKECVEHSSMKCKICKNLVLPGEAYKTNSDKTMTFHEKCFKCSGCKKKIDGPYANVDGGQYHPDCVPKKLVGNCEQCKKDIFQGQQYAQNPQTKALYHGECAKAVNKRIQDSIPSCKSCGVKFTGPYVKWKGEPYHEDCAKKLAGQK